MTKEITIEEAKKVIPINPYFCIKSEDGGILFESTQADKNPRETFSKKVDEFIALEFYEALIFKAGSNKKDINNRTTYILKLKENEDSEDYTGYLTGAKKKVLGNTNDLSTYLKNFEQSIKNDIKKQYDLMLIENARTALELEKKHALELLTIKENALLEKEKLLNQKLNEVEETKEEGKNQVLGSIAKNFGEGAMIALGNILGSKLGIGSLGNAETTTTGTTTTTKDETPAPELKTRKFTVETEENKNELDEEEEEELNEDEELILSAFDKLPEAKRREYLKKMLEEVEKE